MNRTLKRPMFRIGGSAGTGITSGLDQPRKQYANGTQMPNFQIGGLPGFLTGFGLNLLTTPPRGNIFATAGAAAQEPFNRLQAQQAAAMKTASDRAFAEKLAKEEREFEESQLEKRLAVEREKIAAGDEFSLNQLTQLYLENYKGDPNAQIKASNHANYIKNILPDLRQNVGDTQIGGIVEEDLSDVDKATKFAKRNKNKVGKIFYDVNSGTLKKLVRDPETNALGFVPFDMSAPITPDDEGEFLPDSKSETEEQKKKRLEETYGFYLPDVIDKIQEDSDSNFGIGFYD